MSTQFNCQKHFYFKLFKELYITIQFSVSTVILSQTDEDEDLDIKYRNVLFCVCLFDPHQHGQCQIQCLTHIKLYVLHIQDKAKKENVFKGNKKNNMSTKRMSESNQNFILYLKRFLLVSFVISTIPCPLIITETAMEAGVPVLKWLTSWTAIS